MGLGYARLPKSFSNNQINKYINVEDDNATSRISQLLNSMLRKSIADGYKEIVFVCIGTDRSTGDCLAPLIGYKLKNVKFKNVYLHGNLENPVHARNLDNTVKEINRKYKKPFIVAIDACLGKVEHIGFITIGEGSIEPGSGVGKDLCSIGNMFITGIVNYGGGMNFITLQNTRLGLVMKMADIITLGIEDALHRLKY